MYRIAFCGKPNVGKSALINALAASRLRVGNWQGVTVEKYEAHLNWDGADYHLVDLPGLRDLSCSTDDQKIATNYLMGAQVDLIVNVIEAGNLEDNLVLSLRLRELGLPMILVVNFADELDKLGWELDSSALAESFGAPVFLVSARYKRGLAELKQAFSEQSKLLRKRPSWKERCKSGELDDFLRENPGLAKLEGLADAEKEISARLAFLEEQSKAEKAQQSFFEQRFLEFKKTSRELCKNCLKKSKQQRIEQTNRMDRVLLHPVLGPVIGLLCMLAVFSLTFSFTDPLINFVDQFFSVFLNDYIGMLVAHAPHWLSSLVQDGILTGLGLVLSFTPLMFILYILIGVVEESGYMVRIAFMADRMMMAMGISGRAIMPLFMGFGCNVPSIYATRTLETEGEKRVTAFLAGFMSCGARLPVLGIFTATFLGGAWAGIALVLLYILGVMVAVVTSLFLRNFAYFKSQGEAYVIDIPPYRWPLLSTTIKFASFRTWSYLKRASTRIVALLVVLWSMTYFPHQGDLQRSYAASLAKVVQPVFKPLGFAERWELIGALPTAIIAKEGALAALGQFLGEGDTGSSDAQEVLPPFSQALAEQGGLLLQSLGAAFHIDVASFWQSGSLGSIEENFGRGIINGVRSLWGSDSTASLKALSFAIFILLTVPCIVTLGAIRQEFGLKFTGSVVLAYSLIPYIASFLFFQVGTRLL